MEEGRRNRNEEVNILRLFCIIKLSLGLLAFTRFSIPFRNFILKFLHSNNLAHMGSFVPVQNPLHNKYYQYNNKFYTDKKAPQK